MILQKLKRAAEDYLGEKVTRPSSPCRPTSTTPSARPPRTPARSPASKVCASSTSPPRRRSPTASTRRRTRRSRSTTSAAAPSTSRCWRSATASSRSRHQRRHAPGRRQHRPAHHRVARRRVPQGNRHRPAQGQMALQRLKEAAEKAKIELSSTMETDDQPAVPHRRRHRPEAPGACKLTRAKLEQLVDDLIERCDRARPAGASPTPSCQPARHRRSRAGRRPTRMPEVQRARQEDLRQGAEQGPSTRTRSWPSARPSRPACSPARSRTSSCSTSRRCPWASRPSAAS